MMPPGAQIAVETCRLCGQNTRSGGVADFSRDIYFFECDRCGRYHMTFEAYVNVRTMDTVFLRAATRQAFEAKRGPLLLTAENLDALPREHENTSIPENVEKFLSYIRNKCPRPAQTVEIEIDSDYPVIDALNGDELRYVAEHAEDQGLVRKAGSKFSLTPQGLGTVDGAFGWWLDTWALFRRDVVQR